MAMTIVFGIGVIVGSLLTDLYFYRTRTTGTLRIDHSNPDKDVYRIELDYIHDLPKKKEIVLTIDNNARLSQE